MALLGRFFAARPHEAQTVRGISLLHLHIRHFFRNAGALMNTLAVDISKIEVFTFSRHFILFAMAKGTLHGVEKKTAPMK